MLHNKIKTVITNISTYKTKTITPYIPNINNKFKKIITLHQRTNPITPKDKYLSLTKQKYHTEDKVVCT